MTNNVISRASTTVAPAYYGGRMDNPNYDYLTLLRQMASEEGVEATLCSDFAGGASMHRIASTYPHTIVELHGEERSAAAILHLDDDGRVD